MDGLKKELDEIHKDIYVLQGKFKISLRRPNSAQNIRSNIDNAEREFQAYNIVVNMAQVHLNDIQAAIKRFGFYLIQMEDVLFYIHEEVLHSLVMIYSYYLRRRP